MDYPQSPSSFLSGSQASEGDELEQLKSTFIQNVSHELRTPLQIVQGYASLLREGDLGVLAPEQEEAILVIADRADELRSLVERIGLLLSIEGQATVSEPFAFDNIVAEVAETQQKKVEEAGLELETHIEPNLMLLGDPYHLEQAVDCLLDNAIKFTPDGGQVQIAAYEESDQVCLTVTDTGIGIEESDLEHIFSGFYQVDGSTTRRYRGLGLGLTVVKAVTQSHNGQIRVESDPGHGSRFTVKLPAMPSGDVASRFTEGETTLQRVLIVDDEKFVVLTLGEALSSLPNCEVTTATSGAEALKLFRQQPFELLITDYRMPDTNGIDLAKRIEKLYPDTVIIMITAYGDDMLREEAAQSPIRRIMDKPVQIAEIRDVTMEALGRLEEQYEGDNPD